MFSTFSEYTRAFHILFHPHGVWNPSGTEIAAVRQQNFNGYTATTGKNSPSLFFSFVRHLCSSTLAHLLSNIRWTSHRHQCLTRMPVVDVVLVHLDMCWLLCDPTVRRVTWLHSRFGFSLPRTKSRKSPMCSSYFKPFIGECRSRTSTCLHPKARKTPLIWSDAPLGKVRWKTRTLETFTHGA